MNSNINVYDLDGQKITASIPTPAIFSTPVRKDIVELVFVAVRMDARMPYGVSPLAGMQHSAHSWGTGRALARVPRISGGGTSRAGQGAFANFCRKGRLAHPTKVIRKWQRNMPLNTKRQAVAMSISASAIPPLVESRGHLISSLKQIPLVISGSVKEIKNTKNAFLVLKNFGFEEELTRIKENINQRAGKGKMRNRRYVKRKGVLIIYGNDIDVKAFRNIEGVDMMSVDELNILELAPGGHLGRLILWTEDAIKRIDAVHDAMENYSPPMKMATVDDVEGVFYSDEVQAFINKPNYIPVGRANKTASHLEEANPYYALME